MDAKKCDRCRNFYEPYRGINPIIPDGPDTRYRHPYNYIVFCNEITPNERHKYVDLCPECMERLRRWMEAGGSLEN